MKCQTCGRPTKVYETRKAYEGAVTRRMSICSEKHRNTTYEITKSMWNSARSVFEKSAKGMKYNIRIQALCEQKQRMLADRLAGMTCPQLAQKYSVSLHMARYYSRLPRAKVYPAAKNQNGTKLSN